MKAEGEKVNLPELFCIVDFEKIGGDGVTGAGGFAGRARTRCALFGL
jgi:hypothetical protein